MVDQPLSILQINSSDMIGGAQRVAWNLFEAYRDRGCQSYLAVGYKHGQHPNVFAISDRQAARGWPSFYWDLHARLQQLDENGRLSRFARKIATPQALLDTLRGIEDFHYPGTWSLLNLPPFSPHILHCHNLHIGYFDLRALRWLSHQVPTILTLHDAWLLSGHCAHSFNCERWRIGCGECPDLSIYPDIRRDATAYNWLRKREIYEESSFYIATPSQWLMEKAKESILTLGMVEARVIPNGVDLTVFHPADRGAIRAAMGIAQDSKVLLFSANGIRRNIWKDYRTLRSAIGRVAVPTGGQPVLLIALGESGPSERVGQAEIRFVPYQRSPEAIARYFQAADLYIHAARVDTFPNTIIEALACGTPVIATAVGGIPEQIKGLKIELSSVNSFGLDEATGLLVSPGDAEELAARIKHLLADASLRLRLSSNAAADARRRFSLGQQVDAYLVWYDEILRDFNKDPSQVRRRGTAKVPAERK